MENKKGIANQMKQKEIMQKLLTSMPQTLLPLVLPIPKTNTATSKKLETKKASSWDASHNTAAGKNMSGRLAGHGMNLDTETYQKALASQKDDDRRLGAEMKSIGYKWGGTVPAIGETLLQIWKNHQADKKNQELIDIKNELKNNWYNKAYHGHEMDLAGKTDDIWQGISKLENQANDVKTKTPVDQSLVGQRMMAESRKYHDEATKGLTGFDKFKEEAFLSLIENLPAVAAGAVATPAAGAVVGGVMTAGDKASELNARGINPTESIMRAGISSGIGALSDRLPVQKNAANYLLNYLADRAAGDPESNFSLEDLLKAAAMEEISGRISDLTNSGTSRAATQDGRLNPYDYIPQPRRLPYAGGRGR
jgi:hypothetical protein